MPFLTILGSGSWQPERGVRYGAGIHEVDEETALKARRLGRETFIVTDQRPDLAEDHDGPITLEDLTGPGNRGIRLRPAPEEVDSRPEEIEPTVVMLDFPCPHCDASFPTNPPLARHVELHHPPAEVS